jgi:hypothetical protein
MLYAAIICFAIALLFGMVLLGFVIQGKKIPRVVSLSHGPLAIAGITILIIYAFINGKGPITSIVLFIIAALGGLMMFYKDITRKKVPPALALVHGIVAFIAFVVLVIYTFVPL